MNDRLGEKLVLKTEIEIVKKAYCPQCGKPALLRKKNSTIFIECDKCEAKWKIERI